MRESCKLKWYGHVIIEVMMQSADQRQYGVELIWVEEDKLSGLLQVNYMKRSSFDFVTHLEFSSLALQI
jgi:hypothetical protein